MGGRNFCRNKKLQGKEQLEWIISFLKHFISIYASWNSSNRVAWKGVSGDGTEIEAEFQYLLIVYRWTWQPQHQLPTSRSSRQSRISRPADSSTWSHTFEASPSHERSKVMSLLKESKHRFVLFSIQLNKRKSYVHLSHRYWGPSLA